MFNVDNTCTTTALIRRRLPGLLCDGVVLQFSSLPFGLWLAVTSPASPYLLHRTYAFRVSVGDTLFVTSMGRRLRWS